MRSSTAAKKTFDHNDAEHLLPDDTSLMLKTVVRSVVFVRWFKEERPLASGVLVGAGSYSRAEYPVD